MRITFFIRTLDNSGGTERITSVLANHLVSIGHEVSIIAWEGGLKTFFKISPAVKLYYLFEEKGINIYTRYLTSLSRYNRISKKLKPQVVIDVCVPLSILSLPISRFNRKFKVISWEHFNTGVKWNILTSNLSRRLVANFSYKTIVLTATDRHNYIKEYNAKRIDYITNPITIEHRDISPMDSKFVLSIGRFTEQKGFDLLLKAWSIVTQNEHIKSTWKLRIVGDGEQKSDLIALWKGLKLEETVHFILPTNQIDELYKSSSIYIMSSRFEGLPLVLIEAKSYGIPIVSFDCETGPREVVRNNIDGFLVEKEDINGLANKITELINDMDKRLEFSKNALSDTTRFKPDLFFKSWISILESIQ